MTSEPTPAPPKKTAILREDIVDAAPLVDQVIPKGPRRPVEHPGKQRRGGGRR